jgi:ATP adenylyltransferase
MRYIENHEVHADGVFSELPKHEDGPGNLIVHRGDTCYIVLNLYPYNSGHCMVVPFRAVAEPGELTDAEMLEMMQLVALVVRALRRGMGAQGFNLGMNLGRVAGAGIPRHVHFHVVPRWAGDTNFMPVVGGTKVMPESLEDTYAKVRQAIDEERRA